MSLAPVANMATFLKVGSSAAVPLPRFVSLRIFVGMTVLVAGFANARSPVTTPLQELEIQRSLLAGSDALLERMVIPPNRPDWLLTDCDQSSGKLSRMANGDTTYDRMRHSLCEAASKANLAVRH